MAKKDTPKPPTWLWAIAIIVVAIIIITNIYAGDYSGILGGLVALFCAGKCYDWGYKINKNAKLAFAIGFLFSLFGLLFYYIYYRIKRKKK